MKISLKTDLKGMTESLKCSFLRLRGEVDSSSEGLHRATVRECLLLWKTVNVLIIRTTISSSSVYDGMVENCLASFHQLQP